MIRNHGEDLLNKPLSLTAHPFKQKLSSKFQLPLQLRRKIQMTKNVIELCLFTKFSSLIMFYCNLLGNKKLFCDPMKT